uniref:Aminotransferase-like plant mobile domain-containing protein n=1 Tax=Ananas comosus var. bracteatus TaxID=296719 RepID=A0A6V7P567_ANACO|nr:unnamed protein product [Ananas comosus var. bracteatus]
MLPLVPGRDIDVPRIADSIGTLIGYWDHFLQYGNSANYYIPKVDRVGKVLLHCARWWSNSVHSSFRHGVAYLLDADERQKKRRTEDALKKEKGTTSRFISSTQHKVLGSTTSTREPIVAFPPSYDHIKASFPDNTPQREVLGLSFPIHNEVESKSNNDPEDTLSPYGDEVDYEPTPSPPEPFEINDMDVPFGENVDIHLDSAVGDSRSEIPIIAKSFLIDRIMDTMKTFNRRKFRSAREEVSKYCQCLSTLGIDTSELESRIKPIFDHAEAIEELESSPNFIPTVRLMNANENLALRKRKLASHISTKSFLLQATESVSLQLQQTREKIRELEESISHLMSTEAELSLKLEVADDSLKKLTPTQEELQKDVVDAEKEHAAAIEGYNDSKESLVFENL